MPTTTIIVAVSARNITVQPTRQYYDLEVTNQQIVWRGAGNGVTIENVDFDGKQSNAPVTNLGPGPSSGQWQGTWDMTRKGVWRYSILVAVGGTVQEPPLDPEIENDPPGG